MRIHVLPTAEVAAERAALWLRAELGRAVAARGRASLALSGGRTPWRMLHELRRLRVPWHDLDIFQVDERVVPAADERRNARQIADLLVAPDGLDAAALHAMPVEHRPLADGADEYAALLAARCGDPPVLDVVQLGLGADGHTASLVPGDPLLERQDRDVALSVAYQGTVRMTLTWRVLDAARHRLWLVTGADKATALARLWAGDRSIPAGRVARESAWVFADAPAAAALPPALRTPH
ncbi:MAG: 6-phosphogluconolactonase [Proteobacteria bacterium]|nr:6-phosphogluconolactonase [Pseudomonadota bacterium]